MKNLQLKDVSCDVQQNGVAGGIAVNNSGTITACSVNGDITASNGAAGGIAVSNSGTITACWYNGQLEGYNGIGGTIAYINYGSVAACYWSGNADQGVYSNQGGTAEATKVNDNDSWENAINGMNAAITTNDYKWELSADGLPELKRK